MCYYWVQLYRLNENDKRQSDNTYLFSRGKALKAHFVEKNNKKNQKNQLKSQENIKNQKNLVRLFSSDLPPSPFFVMRMNLDSFIVYCLIGDV